MTQQVFVGVGVAKDWLDIHHPARGAARIDNSPAAARSFAARCAKEGAWIVFEVSGGHDYQLRRYVFLAARDRGIRSLFFAAHF